MHADLLPESPRGPDDPREFESWDERDEDVDLDFVEMPCTDGSCPTGDEDDARWEAFIPDEDEWDPQPDPGDFCARLVVVVFALAV